MKRCPECEFIYEDDQSLCDMDGVLLVFDSRKLPDLDAQTTVPARAQTKRNRAVPAFASLTLALVLGMVYYVSTYRKTAQSVYTPPPSAASIVNPVPVAVENPTAEAKPPETEQPAGTVEPPKATPKAAAATAVRKPTVKPTPIKATSEPKKEDSKVGSILKKTGRILKKPFKF